MRFDREWLKRPARTGELQGVLQTQCNSNYQLDKTYAATEREND
jgi:hypothetical protein